MIIATSHTWDGLTPCNGPAGGYGSDIRRKRACHRGNLPVLQKLRGTAYGNRAGIMDSKASVEKNTQVKEQIQPVELIQDSSTMCHNSNILGNKTQ